MSRYRVTVECIVDADSEHAAGVDVLNDVDDGMRATVVLVSVEEMDPTDQELRAAGMIL